MTILQTGRYNEILDKRGAQGSLCGLDSEFIKKVFADTMKENEINTIIKKMSHSETECLIKLNPDIIQ